MHLIQFRRPDGTRAVAVRTDEVREIPTVSSVYELAQEAIREGVSLLEVAASKGSGALIDYDAVAGEGRLLAPIDHPDSAHLYVTGTGLTHLGSASTRDAMHQAAKTDEDNLTDSMKMFRMGLEAGRPAQGETGVQPEWFYKGNGTSVIAPGAPIPSPWFAKDAGEEPEIAGIYVIGPDGVPYRLGFAIGNEFSDHVTERVNYLYLAHSKLRACAFGPELLIGDLPSHVAGTSRILRNGKVLWEKPFVSGEDNMSHTIGNLEFHHFKYGLFCQPGDVHVHMFGTATLSFADGISTQEGDVFEIQADAFGRALVNPISIDRKSDVTIKSLY